jgi:hypothetical protein
VQPVVVIGSSRLRFEGYEDNSAETSTCVDDGEIQLSADQVANKHKSLSATVGGAALASGGLIAQDLLHAEFDFDVW